MSSHAREPPNSGEYEFNGRSADSGARMEWLLIEDMEGNRLGYVQHLQWCYEGYGEGKDTDPHFMVMRMELKPGVGYLHLMPSLLREIWKKAKTTPIAVESKASAVSGIQFHAWTRASVLYCPAEIYCP